VRGIRPAFFGISHFTARHYMGDSHFIPPVGRSLKTKLSVTRKLSFMTAVLLFATRNRFVFSANGTRRVAEEQAEKIDHQAGSTVRHLPGNNGHRRL